MSIRNAARFLAAVVLVGAGFVGTSQASTISIVPGSQTIAPGATAGIDIVLTGLSATETVGAFSIVLSFNDTILDGLTFVNDPGHKMGAPPRDCAAGALRPEQRVRWRSPIPRWICSIPPIS